MEQIEAGKSRMSEGGFETKKPSLEKKVQLLKKTIPLNVSLYLEVNENPCKSRFTSVKN